MSKFVVTIILLLHFSTPFSQTIISGNISGMTFKPSGNPWIVSDNVFVENENKIIIEAGTVFLFKPFSGMIVQGSFIVEGTPEMPVVFTSINDTLHTKTAERNPDPFDWNGITVERSAQTVKMSNFVVTYSVFGIKSRINDVVIEKGIFRQNGQFNFTINDTLQNVENNLPFNYNITEKDLKKQKTTSIWMKPVGITTIAAGTAFLAAMGYFIKRTFEMNDNYENAEDNFDSNDYLDKRDDAVKNAMLAGIIGAILVPAGAGLLVWEHKTEHGTNTVAVCPVTGGYYGLQLVMKF